MSLVKTGVSRIVLTRIFNVINVLLIKIQIGKQIVLHIVNFANRGIPNLRFWGLVLTRGITGT